MPDSREYDRSKKRQHSPHSRRSRSPERRRSRSPQSRRHSGDRSPSPHRRSPSRHHRGESDQDNKRYEERRRRKDDRRSFEDKRYFERKQSDEKPAGPNINVVLRGLPDNATEEDIAKRLGEMNACIEEVSLIKSRETGESRKFAFVRFTSVGHAMQFVEKHRTFHMKDFRVRVDYSHKNNGSLEKEEWRCATCGKFNDVHRRVCVECKQSNIRAATETRTYSTDTLEINDGTKDVSLVPSHLILLRGLDHLTTEESIFKAISSFQGLYRTLLIRDKLTKLSCSFAFIEFTDIKSAMIAMDNIGYYGLVIDGRYVQATFGNSDSFIPVYGQSEYAIPVNSIEGFKAYWEKSSYASQYSPAIEAEKKRREEELRRAKEEERKRQEQYKASLQNDLTAFFNDMSDFATNSENADIFSVPKNEIEKKRK
ncbi:uncharacterized protein RHIMIDRAFT_134864 [Rhizopus microsporus ATCC 52813]|uniref:RRM domain-containing protein n=1 Tax=Rhizopus microsporus ATCC 52813 TaxID=1340429 RepID=A0A2G4SV37_RHIZD|nr:uncharacterized protein RHIMIDRAFT_134864 [Rhizopus microsporus ATCC 52813]PHZ12639.1 hypothetical protein RHIMIDRAFT_134864 [Rhizopus microsporus ATCC 52813]